MISTFYRSQICCVAVLTLVGCVTAPVNSFTATRSPSGYQALEMSYEVEGQSNSLSTRLAKVRSHSEYNPEESLENEFTHTRIQISYPHPDLGPEMAEVKLLISRHAPEMISKGWMYRVRESVAQAAHRPMRMVGLSSQFETPQDEVGEQEIWTMQLPKAELDLLVTDLTESGFFSDQLRPKGAVMLTCSTDGRTVSKRWSSEARLEEFINRTYNEGTLAGFERIPQAEFQQVSYQQPAKRNSEIRSDI